MDKNRNLLIIGSVWPEPDSSAAGRRMMQLITLFQDEGWDITFASTAAKAEHAANLEELNVQTVPVQMNSATFDDFIAGLQPDAVMFDRFIVEEQFGWRVAEQCPQALRILDTEDLHCLRRSRKEALKQDRKFHPDNLLRSESAKREIASIFRCDCCLIISEYEMELLRDLFGIDSSLLHYLPFMVDPIDEKDIIKWPDFNERSHFMTIGNFRHAPNMDAVQYLYKEIWPLIHRELPEAELHIYGAYPSKQAKDLHQPGKGFYIKGRAKSADEVMRKACICLAPLRFGAGLKGKLVEAMQFGTPSITTSVGAEGTAGGLEWPGTVSDQPKKIAEAAVKLYTDKPSWEEAQQRGIEIINSRFAAGQFGPDFMERTNYLLANLNPHRQANFTGAMLMHHTVASTKYMSKWIEEKNK